MPDKYDVVIKDQRENDTTLITIFAAEVQGSPSVELSIKALRNACREMATAAWRPDLSEHEAVVLDLISQTLSQTKSRIVSVKEVQWLGTKERRGWTFLLVLSRDQN